MTVGTSTGEQYEDPFDHLVSSYKGKAPDSESTMVPGFTDEEVTPGSRPGRTGPVSTDVRPPDKPTTLRDIMSGSTMPKSPSEAVSNFGANIQDVFKGYLSNIKVNRSYDVPYISGPSNDGKTVYVDKSVPKTATLSGQTFDTAEPLKIHELVEKAALEHYLSQGMDKEAAYKKAHEDHAEPAENAWYMAHGIDPKEADKWWSRVDQRTEKEGTEGHPPDLYTAPYPHDKVEGSPGATHIDDPSWAKAKNIIGAAGAFMSGGIHGVLEHQGVQTPDWMRTTAHVMQNPEAQTALGLFGGVNSKALNLGKMNKFLEAESRGENLDRAFEQTGFSRGAEGKIRHEISDKYSKIFPHQITEGEYSGHWLKDVLHHPELYKHYPDLKGLAVYYDSKMEPGQALYYNSRSGQERIHVSRNDPDLRSTLMHEIQHAIQDREGFAVGGNPDEMLAAAQRAYPERFDERGRVKRIGDYEAFMDNVARASFKAYKSHAGEQEAFNVENRLKGNAEHIPPDLTEEIPRSEQIVRGVGPPS